MERKSFVVPDVIDIPIDDKRSERYSNILTTAHSVGCAVLWQGTDLLFQRGMTRDQIYDKPLVVHMECRRAGASFSFDAWGSHNRISERGRALPLAHTVRVFWEVKGGQYRSEIKLAENYALLHEDFLLDSRGGRERVLPQLHMSVRLVKPEEEDIPDFIRVIGDGEPLVTLKNFYSSIVLSDPHYSNWRDYSPRIALSVTTPWGTVEGDASSHGANTQQHPSNDIGHPVLP